MMYSTREISPDAMQKPAGNKGKHTEGQCMETLGSAQEHDWVVGLQILTGRGIPKITKLRTLQPVCTIFILGGRVAMTNP